MIISLVDDASWQSRLGQLPEWNPPVAPTLVLAPHPDDETLGAGALIATLRAADVPVSVVAATDGENCYDLPPDERQTIRKTREAEQLAASSRLGVLPDAIHRLRLTDSGLHLQEEALVEKLLQIVTPGMHLLAPWLGDFHPDHEACARAAARVATIRQAMLTSYFFWTWHRGDRFVLDDLPVRRFVPDGAALHAKAEALECHASQLHWTSGEPILPRHLLGPAFWPFEVFLPA